MKPTLAITLGCPAGIGPEIVAHSVPAAAKICTPVLFGHWPTFARCLETTPNAPTVTLLDSASGHTEGIGFVHTGGPDEPITSPNPDAAKSGYRALEMAMDAVRDGICGGVATAPVSKEVIATVAPGFTGHTEFLANRTGLGRDDVTMLFATHKLVVGLITTHLPLKEIPGTITRARYERTMTHVADALKRLTGAPLPRIGVAGLNPHAGENGLLGDEEMKVIGPFCEEFDGRVAHLAGPIPADAIFRDAFAGKFDGVIAAYHDQALIPLKLGGFGGAVNVTGGLPFVRTSPDHGTAYEIAGKGVADFSAMETAIGMAVELINGGGQ